MTRPSGGKGAVLLSTLPLLMSESADDFASLRTAIEPKVEPKGINEQIYVDDIAAIVWEIRRHHRLEAVHHYEALATNASKLSNLAFSEQS